MFAQIPLFPEQASAIAQRVDSLFFFLLAVTGTVAIGVFVLVMYFSIRYRQRAGKRSTPRITGSTKLELLWSTIPFLIFLVMFVWGAQIYFVLAQPPKNAIDLYVVGKQWMWKVQHPQGQREINEVHVPLGEPVKLTLTSEDVIHDFFVPAFRTKIDVLPGRYVYTWFTPTAVGRYHLFCAQYCGTNHAGMQGVVEVMNPADYDEWLNLRAEGSLALEGRKLFLKLQCITCHSANAQARAPLLENLYGQLVPLRGGGAAVADDNYIRESILNPQSKVVMGWEPIMPTFQSQVDEEDLIKLIAFIKSLGTGQTPIRTEEAQPPPSITQPPPDQSSATQSGPESRSPRTPPSANSQ
ncbi:MAG TPA: cytochrome c oxidase subunit II [Pirellulales bacterium]|jgi:cytochrome c oxidase subunit 2